MKVIFGLLLLIAIVGTGVYYISGMASYDPGEQAEAFRKDVKAAKTWQDVLALRTPKTWAVLDYANEYSMTGRSTPRKFKEEEFKTMMQNAQAPVDGFIFEYIFDAANALDVTFDQAGTVVSVTEALTSKDLLDGNLTP